MRPKELKDYKPYHNSKYAIPSLTCPAIYKEAQVARFWNRLPWELPVMEQDKIAQLYAAYDVYNMIEQYYSSEQARIQDRLAKEK